MEISKIIVNNKLKEHTRALISCSSLGVFHNEKKNQKTRFDYKLLAACWRLSLSRTFLAACA